VIDLMTILTTPTHPWAFAARGIAPSVHRVGATAGSSRMPWWESAAEMAAPVALLGSLWGGMVHQNALHSQSSRNPRGPSDDS